MQKKLIIFLLVAFCFCNAQGSSFAEIWQKANQLYEQKLYDSALPFYEKIARQEPRNAEIYYNLGNVYYRLNRMGPAILNYERAIRIDPKFKSASDNLALAQSRISNRIQPINDIFFIVWWRALTNSHYAGEWAITSLLLFLLSLFLMLVNRLKKINIVAPQLIAFLGLFWMVTLVISFVSAGKAVMKTSAVVIQNDAPLLNNEQKSKAQTFIPEGTVIEIINENSAWAEVRLPDGRTGWISQTQFNKI